jgi:putative membrane protein
MPASSRAVGRHTISYLLYFVVMAAAMMGLSRVMPGFEVKGWGPAFLAAFVLAVVNTIVKPVLFVLTLPFTILTLGLFLFVLNALMLWLTAKLVPGFDIRGAGTTFLASLILAAVGMVWKAMSKA